MVLAGCNSATFVFSPTLKAITAKPDNCPVDVMTSTPSRGFQEVGTLDFYNGTEPKTLDAFKKSVHKQVCEVGGDAAIAIADEKGLFTKGTVIAYTDSGAPVHGETKPVQQMDNELPK
jgi:hypothetical protein